MIKLNAIRLERLKAGMCQHEAASKSGIPQSQISLFERGLKAPSPGQLEALSRVYRVEAFRKPNTMPGGGFKMPGMLADILRSSGAISSERSSASIK